MTSPTPTTRTVRSVDVPLGPGRQTLRITLARDQNGEPETLIFACGFGGGGTGEGFHRPHWCGTPLQLPGATLETVRDALDALREGKAP